MRQTHRHILELVLLLVAVRLGGVDLNSDSRHRKVETTPVTLVGGLHQH